MTQYLPADLFDLPVKIPVIKIKKKNIWVLCEISSTSASEQPLLVQ